MPRSAVKMSADMVGYDVETGGKPWDPWGLSKLSDTYPGLLGTPANVKVRSSGRSRRARGRRAAARCADPCAL